ncbi:MAG: hypothetical protein HY960_01480 [Ignavibacteriae bacterium]|nr:hypothetical protein [Ignavibacteriota bacterium]
MSKQEALDLIQQLPDEVTTDEIIDELYVREKILSSMKKVEAGESISYEEAKVRMSRWLE